MGIGPPTVGSGGGWGGGGGLNWESTGFTLTGLPGRVAVGLEGGGLLRTVKKLCAHTPPLQIQVATDSGNEE